MTDNVRKQLIRLICAILAMFVWILAAVLLTGGRDIPDFTETDKKIMTSFLVVFFLNAAVVLWIAGQLGVQIGKQRESGVLASGGIENKREKRPGLALGVLSVLIATAMMTVGIVLKKSLPASKSGLFDWMMGLSILIVPYTLVLSMCLAMLRKKHWDKQQVSQVQQFVYSHREQAAKTTREKMKNLKRIRLATAVYACFLAVVGLCMGLSAGFFYDDLGVTFAFVSALVLLAAFSRIRFPERQQELEDARSCVRAVRYPVLYQLAEKAAEQMECYGTVRIMLMADCNAGILKCNDTYYVQLGVLLLNVLTEEELSAVLLHEFAHVAYNNREVLKEQRYHTWLQGGGTPVFAHGLVQQFFSFPDKLYQEQYMLYTYASAILAETDADRAMLLSGSAENAAAALVKLKYYELFSWEKGTYDESCDYEQEQPPCDLLRRELEVFQRAITQNEEKWKELIRVEIQSRSATHPVLRMRLQTLGVQQWQLCAAGEDTQYALECKQALDYVDQEICQDITHDYEQRRHAFYLEPKACVDNWENAGRPVVSNEYADVIRALRQLGRNAMALELCQMAIEQLPAAASVYGYFMRGCYRLHSYDAAGIEDIYTAMKSSNYWEEGLEAIGAYCCITGNQQELDIYREKAVSLAQKFKEDYSQVGELNPKDHLVPENLPEGMLEDILAYIASVEEGQIEKIYLVRKVISEELFSSVFVIRFGMETTDQERYDIKHKVFEYLDTCSDWQFSLFDYENVMKVPLYKVENSCIYERAEK